MPEQYEKIAYIWDAPGPPIAVPDRLHFKPFDTVEIETFTGLVARVMDSSLDRSDQKETGELGALQAATDFLEEASDWFDYEPSWWQIGMDGEGRLVGFILPVLFRGADKDGLGEGTFYYLGVAPEHRGSNYVTDLLRQGTKLLQEIGVWRIYSDTDALNAPMIKAFQDVGYKQTGSPKSVPL